MEALYNSVASKWKEIGILLEIPCSSLKGILARHTGDPQQCLMEMLELWLERVEPPPIWAAMIEAVHFVGEEQLALQLKQKYCSDLS